jgi:hypothetical protein
MRRSWVAKEILKNRRCNTPTAIAPYGYGLGNSKRCDYHMISNSSFNQHSQSLQWASAITPYGVCELFHTA